MSQTFKVHAVDDDPLILDVIRAILEPEYRFTAFENAEACCATLETDKPDLFFLDVSLPGMNGFDLCRKIKEDPELCSTPVIFVSGHDTIEERLQGYDAGGDDFIVKPFEPEELMRKLKVAQNRVFSCRLLNEQIREAEQLSTLVMASMDETGILLQFMSKLIAMESPAEIAQELLELLRRYRLEGVVQTRGSDETLTVSAAGTNIPLEESIIQHVRHQGRIFEFSRRSVHNFERITLMINNLPLEDPDFCGRLRDHLAVLAESADMRLAALDANSERDLQKQGIEAALDELRAAMQQAARHSGISHRQGRSAVLESIEQLGRVVPTLGLTEVQTSYLSDLISHAGDETQTYFDEVAQQESDFADVAARLQRLAQADYRL